MLVILLAAGSGTRMGALTIDRPKALVEIDGCSILERNIRNFSTVFPSADICVVAGYKAEAIVEFARKASTWASIQVLHNADYISAGPLRSIQIGLSSVASPKDVMIGNGDTIFSNKALAAMGDSPRPARLLISPGHESQADDIQVRMGEHGNILVAAKRLARPGTLPISAGLLALTGDRLIASFFEIVARCVEEERISSKTFTWHSSLACLAEAGDALAPVIVDREWWWEFDSEDCINRYRDASVAGS